MIGSEEEARGFVETLGDARAIGRLDRLAALLEAENQRQNLIAANTVSAIWRRHIADSAQLLSHVPRETDGPWLDLGTGAGFPGLVIATLRPDWRVVLVESRSRRVEWLNAAIADLDLRCCEVRGARLESVDAFPASVISARAFAPMPRLVALSARFSTSDTIWLLPKGRSAAQDLGSLPKALRQMFHVEQSVTDAESGIITGRLQQNTERKA